MDLTSKRVIQGLLKKYRIHPSKKFGQNFLIDKSVLKKIIETAKLRPTDIVLEIGPGIGSLTRELAKRAKKVIAVEKDLKMVEILKEVLKDFKNVKIIKGDILKIFNFQLQPYGESRTTRDPAIFNYKVVANLPYYIVTPVIRKLLEIEDPPSQMILMVQKEVAQRICAKPPKVNLLAVSIQFYAKPKIISYVSKKSFWPQPKVDGAIIKIKPSTRTVLVDAGLFFRIVKAGFSHPRKQIINNFSKGLKIDREKTRNWLLKNKVQPFQRAETLTVNNWIKLTKSYKI